MSDIECKWSTPSFNICSFLRQSDSWLFPSQFVSIVEIKLDKAFLEPRVSPAFAITYFCNHCNIRFENTSKYVDTLTLFPKTWTKGHWPLDDLWPHVCWGHMCDSTQGSLCPSPMIIHQCMWIQWSILQNTTYIHILHTYTYILHTTYRMSDHIVSYWTQLRRDKKIHPSFSHLNPLKTIAVNKVTNRWRNHNNKTTKIFELNKVIALYEL